MALLRRGGRTRGAKSAGDTTTEWLIVGLGNPGAKYRGTRHNVGQHALELLAHDYGVTLGARHEGLFATTRDGEQSIALLTPLTYMNLSGTSVRQAMRACGVTPDRVVVVHDELDLPMGTVRVKVGGGLAGHNGLRSIADSLHTQDFVRVRLGIGRPEAGDPRPIANWVLMRFEAGEDGDTLARKGAETTRAVISRGAADAMNTVNAER